MANLLIDSFKQDLLLYRTNKLLVLGYLESGVIYEVRLYPHKRIPINELPKIAVKSDLLLNQLQGEYIQLEANRFGLCFTAQLSIPNDSPINELLNCLKR